LNEQPARMKRLWGSNLLSIKKNYRKKQAAGKNKNPLLVFSLIF